MLSARTLRASVTLPFRLLGALPTQCLVCHAWQQASICGDCRALWLHARPRCLRCAIDLHTASAHGICPQCEDQSPEFDRAIAAMDYTAPWSPLLAQLKFRGGTALARPLGQLLAQAAAPRRGRVGLIVPVPLSRQRLMERGYNQSWLLAQQVARQLKLPARHDLLIRSRHTSRLMSLSAEERQLHIRNAFQVTRHGHLALKGRDVAVVDDVMTTGATLNAVATTLLESGVRSVSAWVVARTPAPCVVSDRGLVDAALGR